MAHGHAATATQVDWRTRIFTAPTMAELVKIKRQLHALRDTFTKAQRLDINADYGMRWSELRRLGL